MQTPPEKALSVQIHKPVEYLSIDIQMQISKLMGKLILKALKYPRLLNIAQLWRHDQQFQDRSCMIPLNQQKSSFNEGVIFEEKHTPHFHLIRYHLDTGIIFLLTI